MSVRNLLAEIALFCHTLKKDRLVGLLSGLRALSFSLAARGGRSTPAAPRQLFWPKMVTLGTDFTGEPGISILRVFDAHFTITLLPHVHVAKICGAYRFGLFARNSPELIEVDNDFH